MRAFATLLTAVLAVLAWAAADPFDVYVSNIEILQSKAVQADLKISDAQRAALNKHADWYNGQTKKVVEPLQAAKATDSQRQQGATKIAGFQEQLKGRIIKELSNWQVKRLGQISLQQAGIVALLDQRVAKKVGLTDGQLTKLRNGWESSGKRVADAERKAKQPIFDKYKKKSPKDDKEAKELGDAYAKEMQAADKSLEPVLAKAKKEFETLVDTTLTAGQKKAWGDLKGPQFRAK
jgi:transcription termination factor NusB